MKWKRSPFLIRGPNNWRGTADGHVSDDGLWGISHSPLIGGWTITHLPTGYRAAPYAFPTLKTAKGFCGVISPQANWRRVTPETAARSRRLAKIVWSAIEAIA